jgi:hypothetical protein
MKPAVEVKHGATRAQVPAAGGAVLAGAKHGMEIAGETCSSAIDNNRLRDARGSLAFRG